MPWSVSMSAKELFLRDVLAGMTVTEAAGVHGIARSCAYKWVLRYEQFGLDGLNDQSRAPRSHPNAKPESIVEELIALKRMHPHFGPAKLAAMMEIRHGRRMIASSTAGDILSRHNLVEHRARRSGPGSISHPAFSAGPSGHSMTADYKGEFRMGNHSFCYPLTVADPASRFVFAIDALSSTQIDPARERFERVFREYGVPIQMISDNGTPFCAPRGLGGLTRLSRWWIELGIFPVRTLPGHPQQNGVHERMHRSLKDWLRRNTRASLKSQQTAFNAFRQEFNQVRPHEALGQRPPATALGAYRPYRSKITAFDYPSDMIVRSVRSNGYIKWNGVQIFTSEVLVGTDIGLREISDQLWSIHFRHVPLGYLDDTTHRVSNQKLEKQS